MYKIFWSHLFALGIILSITFFHANTDGLMNNVLFSLLAVEMGFFFYYFKHIVLRVAAFVLWCFFYPNNLNVLFSVADRSWATTVLWTTDGMTSFMIYLAVLVFSLVAGTLSLRMILKPLNLNQYIQVFFVMGVAFAASLMFQILRTLGITWKVIVNQHLNIFEQVTNALTTINMPFILGLMVVQVMMFVVLDND
ncbi:MULTISPECIES: hypothetical protein [Streptococcus]|jgi:hypothetical protein|uniref:DUF1361 domain-containing protein n=1 Tax=Streptococcus equinus TaxID=1335 RepID=A0A1G9NDM1_STREI|nr:MULTISPECIES: hypothetical protein [Streptococcus]EQC70529.1 putative transmembrane protein [Streptococcus sp. HSISB1]KEY46753.1 membrane protein [Streptococcus equinus]MBE6163694.1 hypothetical protein [Streptococcus equinus]MDO4885982.1 hypothetical protein [Streptococcus sp.]MEE0950242.1 hypothetical protein [Streptococcus equinus]